jgi:glycosyltransferase involved in cell wall biosynthesis
MRIALLVPGPFDTVSGGYGYDRAIVAGLRADGHDARVIELAGRHPLADEAARASASAAWEALPADAVVVIDGLGLPAFAPLADALAARGAVGLIHHPTALEPGWDEAARERLRTDERALFPRLARVVVTSETTGDRLVADFGVARDRVAVVVPGTPDAPRRLPHEAGTCEILALGVITPRKGHDVLLRAVAKLPDLDWHLTIGGARRDAAHAGSLVALAGELGIAARVSFAGEMVGEVLEAAWQRADVFALATRYEGYGMAIAEALKRGIPVAVTDGGAVGKLVPPQGGAVCPVGDDVSLSKALRRMIFDPLVRRAMADAAWEAGQNLPDWPAQARAFAAAIGGTTP